MAARSSERMKLLIPLALSLASLGFFIPSRDILAAMFQQPESRVWLELNIVDGKTSRPIRKATVQLMSPFDEPDETPNDDENHVNPAPGFEIDNAAAKPMFTDDRGIVTLLPDFDIGDTVNTLRTGSRVKTAGWRVKVSAPGYQPYTSPLFEYTGDQVDTDSPQLIPARVRLDRLKPHSKEEPRYETFVRRELWEFFSLGLYQDKYYSLLSCPKICSEHTPWFETFRGRVENQDGRLLLSNDSQEKIKRQDGEEFNAFIANLTRVRWGDRRYLIPDKQLLAFCNTVNQGEEPRDSDWGEFYMGEGHEKIKVSGLPDLPKPWNQYVLEAPVRGKVVEYLPDMMARVDIGRKDGLRAGMELVPSEEEFFSDQEIVTLEEAHATIKPKYPEGNYRAIRVGDLVSTRRAPRKRAQVR
jgi:hypothetical protein